MSILNLKHLQVLQALTILRNAQKYAHLETKDVKSDVNTDVLLYN